MSTGFCCRFLALAATWGVATTVQAMPPEIQSQVEDSYICVFSSEIGAASAPGLVRQLEGQGLNGLRHVYQQVFGGFSAKLSSQAVQRLIDNNSAIAYCEQNGAAQAGGQPVAGGKGGKPGKPSGEPPPQQIPWGVQRLGWDRASPDATGRIWILDTGISRPDELNIDYASGRNFLAQGKKDLTDSIGHGTHVAGSAAAIDNDIGVVGIAAGATVVPVKVMQPSYWALYDDMIAGIDYVAGAADTATDVASMSIWASEHHEALHQAVLALADLIPFVVIAGNYAEDINAAPSEPAHVEHPNLYTVTAMDSMDRFADFSNFGALDSSYCTADTACGQTDAAAPGVDVLSLSYKGGLVSWEGTSMAAPHLAGLLWLSRNSNSKIVSYGSVDGDPDSVADPIYQLK